MDEYVVAASVGLDKAEPFLFIEEFDCPCLTHRLSPICCLSLLVAPFIQDDP